MERTRAYRGGRLLAEGFPLAEVGRMLAEPDTEVWLDLLRPTAAELCALPDELGLHELAIRNATAPRSRPGITRYPDHLLLCTSAVRLDGLSMETAGVVAFITPRALITVRADERFDVDAVVARWDDLASLATGGVGMLVYGLLAQVVDSHLAAVQALDDAVEEVEDLLFATRPATAAAQHRAYTLRKVLLQLRRVVVPMREVVAGLLRRGADDLGHGLLPYYQDLHDDVLWAAEWTESQRELIATILDSELTIQSNRLNLIMKKVTSWAAIIAVPTAVTGFYGMNVAFPGFGTQQGMITAGSLVVASPLVLYLLFKRSDWL